MSAVIYEALRAACRTSPCLAGGNEREDSSESTDGFLNSSVRMNSSSADVEQGVDPELSLETSFRPTQRHRGLLELKAGRLMDDDALDGS